MEEPDHVADDPAPDVKDQNGQRHPDHSPDQSPHSRIDNLIERHGFQLGDKRPHVMTFQRIDRLGNGRQLGLKLKEQGQQQIHGYSDIFYTFIFLFDQDGLSLTQNSQIFLRGERMRRDAGCTSTSILPTAG